MRVRARRKKNTQPASIAFVFQASRVSTRIALSEASFPPHEHRHFIIIIGTTSSQLHCHDVESHDVAIWIQARACLVVVRPPMNKRKALGATSSGAAQLAAPCAKQSRASSSSAFSACCTGNQGEPPQAVALSAVPQGSTVAAFENGGLFQPPAKKCNRTKEESQPSAVADLIIPRELEPMKEALTKSIEASGDFDEEDFKLRGAYCIYAEWRRIKSLLELSRLQQGLVYDVLRAFLAIYHAEIPAAQFRDSTINAAKAEALYVAYCQNAIPVRQLRPYDMVHLAWAIREQQRRGKGHFLPHAQRYLDDLKDLVCRLGANEESQPIVMADLIIPRELVPIKNALTNMIKSSGDLHEEEFKLDLAYHVYDEWRRRRSLLELPQVQRAYAYNILLAFLAMYHEEVPVAHFRDGKINAGKAKKLYVAYCRNGVPLRELGPSEMVHLAWAIREQQQRWKGDFLQHAQHYLEELKTLLLGTHLVKTTARLHVLYWCK